MPEPYNAITYKKTGNILGKATNISNNKKTAISRRIKKEKARRITRKHILLNTVLYKKN